jgi:MYXO-CTERM domain-containing protein
LALLTAAFVQAAAPSASAQSYELFPNAAIEDGKCTSVSIDVTDNFVIGNLRVGVYLTHPYRGDLDLLLTGPDGVPVRLSSRAGSAAENINVLFDDEAALDPCDDYSDHAFAPPVFTHHWRAEDGFSHYYSKSPIGSWTLKVCDLAAPYTGTLRQWTLTFAPVSSLAISVLPEQAKACAGFPFTYRVEVFNGSTQDQTVALSYSSDWRMRGPSSAGFIPVGASASVAVSVWPDPGSMPGARDTLTVTATGTSEVQRTITTTMGASPVYTDLAEVPVGRRTRGHSLVHRQGKLFKIGGFDANSAAVQYLDIYDLSSGTWSIGADLPAPRRGMDCVTIADRIYCAGGMNPPVSTLFIYDIASDTWSNGRDLPIPVCLYAAAVIDDLYYVAGGWSGGSAMDTTLVYDPVNDTWDTRATLSTPRFYHAGGAIGGRIFVASGWLTGYALTNTAEVYDPVSDSWNDVAPFPTIGVVNPVDAVRDGKLLVLGGGTGEFTPGAQAYQYDPAGNSWAPLPVLPRGIWSGEADADGNDLWYIGGFDRTFNFGPGRYLTRMVWCQSGNAGAPCDDGLWCTTGDYFDENLFCAGDPSCDDGFECTADGCDELADACFLESINFGCYIEGFCVSEGAIDPTNPCRACQNAISATSYSPVDAGTPCDDGLFCTVGTTCNDLGACEGSPHDCEDGLDCTVNVCNETDDACVIDSISVGCLIEGGCVAEGAIDPADPCRACQHSVSATNYSVVGTGTPCEDGLFCTVGTTCDADGACKGSPRDCEDGLDCTVNVCNETDDTCVIDSISVGCLIEGGCVAEGAIDPTDPCRACQHAFSATSYSLVSVGTPCEDGLFCTVGTTCHELGACEGTPRDCEDGLGCTVNGCDETADTCTIESISTGCFIEGGCADEGAIDPADPCRACQHALSPTSYSSAGTGTPCDDGLYCTVGTTCGEDGACEGSPRNCEDGLECTANGCDETADTCVIESIAFGCFIGGECIAEGAIDPSDPCRACQYAILPTSYTPVGAGTPCEDGLFCTLETTCDAEGVCNGGAPRDCEDGLDCTVNGCDDTAGTCVIESISAGCFIDDECVDEGALDPADPCSACQPITDDRGYSKVEAGTPCEDGLFCTVGMTCDTDGDCNGGALRDCADGLDCTVDGCDDTADTCVSSISSGCFIEGMCVAEGAIDPADPCRTCQPATDDRSYSKVEAGTPCEDGLFCTVGTTCNAAGACGGGVERGCADGIDCTVDQCDEDADKCLSTMAPGSCLIGGQCRSNGETNPLTPCEVCDPNNSPMAWSLRLAGFPCGEPSCADGIVTPAPACDQVGTCQKSEPRSCDGFFCADEHSCAVSCSGDLDCFPAYYCDPNSQCAIDLDQSENCERDGMCSSGHCIDGFCCDGSCDGTCEACNVTGHEGFCSAVPEGTDPRDECPGDATCDGDRACTTMSPDAGTPDGGPSTDGGGDSPDDGGVSSDGGGDLPDDGGVSSDGGGDLPDDGGVSSDGGGDLPDDGGVSSDGGGDLPDDSGISSDGGGDSPDDGGVSSDGGDDSPDGGGASTDAGGTPVADGGQPSAPEVSGCGCGTTARTGGSTTGLFVLLGLALIANRRRSVR